MERKKKKVAGVPTKTVDSVKDERFTHILKNPVFRPVPRKEKKIDIDRRFQGMFQDGQFKLKYKVDKRGRPVETTTDENLKRYYNLEGEEDEDGDGEKTSEKDPKRGGKKGKDKVKIDDVEESDSDESDSEESQNDSEVEVEGDVKEDDITAPVTKIKLDESTRKKLHSNALDYARGEAEFTSEESSSDSESSEEDENETLDHNWGELDKDSSRTEDSTRRLALCNMDWDRVRAVDLMVLLNSFLPPGGIIKSINIYPSEFGKQRMAEEEIQGPKELVGDVVKIEKSSDDEEEDDEESNDSDEDGEGSRYHREKLRQYQLNRLKYYYAVAEFDSAQTADKVYIECDGMEYESSAAKVDLRFIPDDMIFEDKPKDACTSIPDSSKYRPRFFTTTALQQIKVDLTWDETDPLRKELTEKIFDPKENIDDDDIRAYLATSSESESDDEGKEESVADTDDKPKESNSKQDAISKYKALLQSIESTEKEKKDKDVQMEITWGVGLKETTAKLVKKKMAEDEKSNRTPWQEVIDKQKEKRKQRKQDRKREASKTESGSDSSSEEGDDQPFSDDEVDIDMQDEFFQSEMKNNEIFKDAKSAKSKKKQRPDKDKPEKKVQPNDASLELLLMDDDDNKKHFSLKKIIDNENDTKSKKKRNRKKRKLDETTKNVAEKDDFEIDVEDQRFSGLFSSHHYNVDPSDPNFKKTKAMDKIIAEKQKRREVSAPQRNIITASTSSEEKNNLPVPDTKLQQDTTKKAELSYLIKSIKRNTENLKTKKSKIRR